MHGLMLNVSSIWFKTIDITITLCYNVIISVRSVLVCVLVNPDKCQLN